MQNFRQNPLPFSVTAKIIPYFAKTATFFQATFALHIFAKILTKTNIFAKFFQNLNHILLTTRSQICYCCEQFRKDFLDFLCVIFVYFRQRFLRICEHFLSTLPFLVRQLCPSKFITFHKQKNVSSSIIRHYLPYQYFS